MRIASRYPVFLLLAIAAIILHSCSIEQKIAKSFVKDPPEIDLQLFTPDILYKFNHKGEDISGFDTLSEAGQDSALFVNSRFLQFVDDSIYLERYMNRFIDELRSLGFTVYLDGSVGSFLKDRPQAYVVNVSQIQLDEYYYPLEDSESYMDTDYFKVFYLNSVDASSWFELSKVNVPKPKKTVLYSSFTATDGFEGNFIMNPFTGDVQYKYGIDSLLVKDIYDLASYAGRRHASFLFDFFMNQYIAFHMPEGMAPQYYLHYDRFRKTLTHTEEERFEILDPK